MMSTSPPVRKVHSRTTRAIVRTKKGRSIFEGDKPAVVTLVRRDTRKVRFFVHETQEEANRAIHSRCDESVTLCSDQYAPATESMNTTALTAI